MVYNENSVVTYLTSLKTPEAICLEKKAVATKLSMDLHI